MAKLKLLKLPGATLIETIVALVIILVIFGIVTTFLVQTSLDSFSLRDIKATEMINNYAAETNDKKAFFNEEMTYHEVYLKREIDETNNNKNMVRVIFSLFDRDHKLIAKQDRLFGLK